MWFKIKARKPDNDKPAVVSTHQKDPQMTQMRRMGEFMKAAWKSGS
jgi:hypothetical protein